MNRRFGSRGVFRGIQQIFFMGLLLALLSLSLFNEAWSEDINDETNIRKELEELRSKVKEMDSLKARVQELESRPSSKKGPAAPETVSETVKEELTESKAEEEKGEKRKILKILSPYLDNLNITGGISGGYFSTTNEGAGNKASNFVLSNLLLELSSEMQGGLLGFTVGLGGVTTPSVFDAPNDTTPNFRVEYASINLKPIKALDALSVEAGLLRPNSGYECTYTFNNRNITVGALASQQPYNAVGSRLTYAFSEDLRLWGGIFRHRLDDEEYRTDYDRDGVLFSRSGQDSDSWEAGVSGSAYGLGLNLYHYHLNDMRHLTGIVAEYTLANVYMAINVDYWKWSSSMDKYSSNDSSIGAALYISPAFGQWSFPLRLEYIDQGGSRIYLDSTDADYIYSVTLTPTYNFTDNVYLRAETSYTHADNGFSDDNGRARSGKYLFAVETGVKF